VTGLEPHHPGQRASTGIMKSSHCQSRMISVGSTLRSVPRSLVTVRAEYGASPEPTQGARTLPEFQISIPPHAQPPRSIRCQLVSSGWCCGAAVGNTEDVRQPNNQLTKPGYPWLPNSAPGAKLERWLQRPVDVVAFGARAAFGALVSLPEKLQTL